MIRFQSAGGPCRGSAVDDLGSAPAPSSVMLLRALQGLVRVAPGPLRLAWAALPKRLQAAAEPFVHPIAAGPRGGRLFIEAPERVHSPTFDVVLDGEIRRRDPELERTVRALGHRVFEFPCAGLDEFARRERILDAVYVGPSSAAPEASAARGLGWRVLVGESERPRTGDGRVDDGSAVDTWLARAFPTVSIVVVTHSNRALCRSCLHALARNTGWPTLDVVVVDNASNDDTRSMLELVAARDRRMTLVYNRENQGFASAVNQGIKASNGEFVVILNDDAAVGPGWLSRLVARFESNERFGLVCPVTNEANSLAQVGVDYATFEDMEKLAVRRAFDYQGAWRETDVISLFCALTRRSILESVGFLDERFAIGMFEDDDLSFALKRRGYDLGIALDSFVHHVGQASFSRMGDSEYLAVWEANRRRFEEKWGVRWHPPRRDPT